MYWRGGVFGEGTREIVETKIRWSRVYGGSGRDAWEVENFCAMWLVREV